MLFDGSDWWKRKGDDDFLIQIGSWDGAESTDLVGLYILSKLSKLDKNIDVGLYRDDGLISSKLTNRQTENIKKKITNIFAQYGLKLEIIANQKIVNFPDVTLDLNKELYTPYMKVNNTIRYVNTKSNHPPSVLKNIPENINNRITRNTFNEQFNEFLILQFNHTEMLLVKVAPVIILSLTQM